MSARHEKTQNRSRKAPVADVGQSEEHQVSESSTLERSEKKRHATVYDAVAGRIGLQGFMTREQLSNPTLLPATPEEVLLRRVNVPDQIPHGLYDADKRLNANQILPDSDLLKAIHAYASDFYAATAETPDQSGFRSFDETALLAMGILLEEAAKQTLGHNGDMALTEPEVQNIGLRESKMTAHQVIGRVVARGLPEYESDASSEQQSEADESPRKRRR